MCNIFKDCRNTFDERLNKNRSHINTANLLKMIYKIKNGACGKKNNMGSEMEVTSCSQDKGKETCFRWTAFMRDYVSACKSQMAFMELDFVPDGPRMKPMLRVMMAEL